jgi:hypothetical protein
MVVDLLGGDELAPLYILRIWAHCQLRRSDRHDGMSAAGLRALCRYTADAATLESALSEAGFVKRDGDAICAPKWRDKNAGLFANWENGRKGGRPPGEAGNPNVTHGKPMGSDGEPNPNPDSTDKRRQEETTDKTVGSKCNGKSTVGGTDASPLPKDARKGKRQRQRQPEFVADLSDLHWPKVFAMAEKIARDIPPTNTTGRRNWLKYAVLAETAFCEDWLMDSMAAVLAAKESRATRQAHFVSVLQSKAREQYGRTEKEFDGLMDAIEIPNDVWQSGVLEVKAQNET